MHPMRSYSQLELSQLTRCGRRIHEECAEAVSGNASLMLGFEAVNATIELIDRLRCYADDQLRINIIVKLFMRSFNSFSTASEMVLSGRYQTSWMLMRDILETSYLIDDFCRDIRRVDLWIREIEDQVATGKSDFSPLKVRCRLDDLDGVTDMSRAKRYGKLCTYGAHPSAEGLSMLHAGSSDARVGPFIDWNMLSLALTELVKLALDVGVLARSFTKIVPSLIDNALVQQSLRRVEVAEAAVLAEIAKAEGGKFRPQS